MYAARWGRTGLASSFARALDPRPSARAHAHVAFQGSAIHGHPNFVAHLFLECICVRRSFRILCCWYFLSSTACGSESSAAAQFTDEQVRLGTFKLPTRTSPAARQLQVVVVGHHATKHSRVPQDIEQNASFTSCRDAVASMSWIVSWKATEIGTADGSPRRHAEQSDWFSPG